MLLKGLNLCSGHMNNWQYRSLGDLEQNELFFGELVANLLRFDKQIGISERG